MSTATRICANDLSSTEIIERTQLLREISKACDAVDYNLVDNVGLQVILDALLTAVAR